MRSIVRFFSDAYTDVGAPPPGAAARPLTLAGVVTCRASVPGLGSSVAVISRMAAFPPPPANSVPSDANAIGSRANGKPDTYVVGVQGAMQVVGLAMRFT